ncbi:MAG: hypothetical protein HYU53_19050 [Acidobacteria bacterium]|nr:hypothetical protein [Acidobacteriota bacterium]
MSIARAMTALVVCVVLFAGSAAAADEVPFRGVWSGQTDSATPVGPGVVLVISSGSGQATHLGRFTMVSPHFTFIDTLVVAGQQIFTAANGDTLTALFTGQFVPNADGNLEATLSAVITTGTGRFLGATGGYEFHIVARPAAFGFDSTATFSGAVTSVGSLK